MLIRDHNKCWIFTCKRFQCCKFWWGWGQKSRCAWEVWHNDFHTVVAVDFVVLIVVIVAVVVIVIIVLVSLAVMVSYRYEGNIRLIIIVAQGALPCKGGG